MNKGVVGLMITFCMAAGSVQAADLQGMLSDWKCTKKMVKQGIEKTLQQDKNCSLEKNYKRDSYGLITDDKKFYELDAVGNKRALELLENSPSKNGLHVLIKGELQGNLIKVSEMSIL
jgi:hypothetical protein